MKKVSLLPDQATGTKLACDHPLVPRFGNKLAVAQMAGFSKRWVDLQMRLGMPHLKVGSRSTRFDLGEVAEWLREKYRVQRRA